MTKKNQPMLEILIKKGVRVPTPESVEIGDEVDPARISGNGVVIYGGCKIFGAETLILEGAKIGYEAPATIQDCYIGPNVRLSGGFFKQAVFLKDVTVGSCAHVREGTILEEGASAAHSVGLKQTILFPFVTLGSLINFCDCLMAGGTGKTNHSEVGSSYIHFNFTPQQDKATASLMGDVPSGVMLNQPPIFLGGQGGLVGPTRLAYGTTIAAGTICRKDELRPHRLIFGGSAQSGNIPYNTGAHTGIGRIFKNNIIYIANLLALMEWYQAVRSLFISRDFPEELHRGLLKTLDLAVAERIHRLDNLMKKAAAYRPADMGAGWPEVLSRLLSCRQDGISGEPSLKNRFVDAVGKNIRVFGADHVAVIQALSPEDSAAGTRWLQGIVDQVAAGAAIPNRSDKNKTGQGNS